MKHTSMLVSVVAAAFLPFASASATTLRFSETAAGNVVATGNTLGLSKAVGTNAPGTEDSIGAFIALDPLSVDGTYPAGTTSDWTENGSSGVLALPAGAEVLYAELVWGGSWSYGGENVSAHLDDAITLAAGGASIDVSPAEATKLTLDELASSGTFDIHYYARSADVTAFVSQHGGATYTVSAVPATAADGVNTLNAAGWTLLVAYRDRNEPIRNLTVFVGGDFVDEESIVEYSVEGFCTPPSGPFEGYVVVTAMEGDANRGGDGLEIAPTIASLFTEIEASNNPVDNFFASQINDNDGDLDTSGTFGSVNHDPWNETNVIGGRQGWDLTRAPLSSDEGHLSNAQTSAVLRAFTVGDSFLPTALGFSIGVNAPNFASGASSAAASPTALSIGESTTVTVTVRNNGLVDATNVLFTASLPTGLTLDGLALDGTVDGSATAASLASGLAVGTVAVGATRTVTLDLTAETVPAGGADRWVVTPGWTYDYVSCVGESSRSEPFGLDGVAIAYAAPVETDTDTDVDTGDGGDGDSRCGCASGGAPPVAWLALLPLLALRRRARTR